MNLDDFKKSNSKAFLKLNPGLGGPQAKVAKPNSAQALVGGKQEFMVISPIQYLDEIKDGIICRVIHYGEPMPKQRPRFSPRGHAYTPQSTKEHQQSIASCAREQCSRTPIDPSGIYGLRAIFYVQTYQRKDVDNLLKTLLDALNGIAFKDDSQIKELMGWSTIDFRSPRTEFLVYRLGTESRDEGLCARCGKPFKRYQSWKTRLFCSRVCSEMSLQNAVSLICVNCGALFTRIPSLVRSIPYCSLQCKAVGNRRQYSCFQCGATVSRPKSFLKNNQKNVFCSTKCFSIWRIGRPINASPETLSARSKKAWATRMKPQVRTIGDEGTTVRIEVSSL